MLKNKKILLGISGGIAAYKSVSLIRLFIKAGAEVKVVVTKNALNFITKVTLETISRNPVYADVFEQNDTTFTEHISITDWADLFIVAPATANTIGKLANGIADDALSTSLVAFDKPVFIAPSMNTKMYNHFSVQRNLEYLKENGIRIIEPTEGELACEWEGKGRMEEPENIFKFIIDSLKKKSKFSGKKVLITAGPTRESIDPVRYISNHSSGLMGYSIAEEFAEQGAEVKLISGPTQLKISNSGIEKIDIVSADEMYQACLSNAKNADIIVMTAAVADFKPAKAENKKIKKEKSEPEIKLIRTKDILAELGKNKRKDQVLVGFALETDNEIENAKKKLNTKNLDFIVINSLNDKGAGFKYKTNKVTIINRNNKIFKFGLKSKRDVAKDIIDLIYES